MNITITHIVDAWAIGKTMTFIIIIGSFAYPISEWFERRIRDGWKWLKTKYFEVKK